MIGRLRDWFKLRVILLSMDLLHWSASLPLQFSCNASHVRNHLDYIIEYGRACKRDYEAQGGVK